MTEKIARRGIHTPDSYEPDLLLKLRVTEVMDRNPVFISSYNTIAEVRKYFAANPPKENRYAVRDAEGDYLGTISVLDIFQWVKEDMASITAIIKSGDEQIKGNEPVRKALELMHTSGNDFVAVVSGRDGTSFEGLLSYKDIVRAYSINQEKESSVGRNLSMERQAKKMIVKGKKMMADRRV